MTFKPKVFGIGLNKTGTTTLAECLRILGYRVCLEASGYTLAPVPTVEAFTLCEKCEGFCDYPWFLPNYYRQLSTLYPCSKFILTTREPNSWWESLERWMNYAETNIESNYVYNSFLREVKDAGSDDVKDLFERLNQDTINFFHDNKNFIVLDWTKTQGWMELCNFLDIPVPLGITFPHRLRYDKESNEYVNT